jgi:hypothetical protein
VWLQCVEEAKPIAEMLGGVARPAEVQMEGTLRQHEL